MTEPLTAGQQAVVLGVLAAEHPQAYQCAELLEFDTPVDTDSLVAAISGCLSAYPPLAREYTADAAVPAPADVRVEVVPRPSGDVFEFAHELIDAAPSRRLAGAALTGHHLLVDSAGRTTAWVARFHHVIADGFGIHGLLRWIADSHRAGRVVALNCAVAPDGPRSDAAAEFFAAQELAETTLRRPGAPGFRRVRADARLTPAERRLLRERAKALGASETEALLGLAASYVARLNFSPTATIGLPVMGRRPGAPADLSPQAHVLPLTLRADGDLPALLAEAGARLAAVGPHTGYRGEWVAADRRAAGLPEHPAGPDVNVRPFAPIFRFAGATATLDTLAVGPISDVELIFQVLADGGLQILVLALTDTTPDQARGHAQRLRHLLVTADPAGALATPEEAEVRGEERALPAGLDLPTLIHATLTRRAGDPGPALLAPGVGELSWEQFARRVNALAGHLHARGIGPGDTVAILLPRSPGLIVAVTAVARLGAAFVAIDPELPKARITTMLDRAAPAARLTEADVALDGTTAVVPQGSLPPLAHPGAQATAYLVFTSGSTGEPKAVAVPQEGIVNRLAWHAERYAQAPDTVMMHKTPVSFDVSVWELLMAGTHGVPVAVAPPGAHRDPEALAEVIAATGVTVVHFVPSALRGFVALAAARGWRLPRLRRIICSGEAVPADLPGRVAEVMGVGVDNLYGPAEASIDVTAHRCVPGEDPVPMGTPVWNTAIRVVDAAGRPQVPGYDGELVLVGRQVATGYLGRPAAGAPFHVAEDGQRSYHTGDIGYLREDGLLIYRGRRDAQVKIHGQRLEEGEVLAALSATPGVEQAAVAVDGDLLCAVVVGTAAPGEVREHVARVLPAYMVPTRVAAVAALPLTRNGKLDRAAVIRATRDTLASPAPVAPSPVAGELAEITRLVGQTAGHPAAGPDDRFFDIGGTSLSAVALALALTQATGVEVRVADVLAHHSARELHGLVANRRRDAGEDDAAFAPALTLRPHRAGTPVVCCHPAGGLGWAYVGLLPRLAPERGVLALQSPGLVPGGEAAASISEQAVGAIPTLPDGEIDLVGWSVGGVLAHELACQLGARVRRLVLLDAYPPEAWAAVPEPDEQELFEGVLAMAGVDPPTHGGGALDAHGVTEVIAAGDGVFAALGERRIAAVVEAIGHNARLMRAHRAGYYPGELTVVVAEANHRTFDPALWEAHAESVRAIRRPVTHPQMVSPAIFELVGELLA